MDRSPLAPRARYAIVAEDDVREAMRRTQEHLRKGTGDRGVIPMKSESVQSRAQVGHNSGAARKRVTGSGSGSD